MSAGQKMTQPFAFWCVTTNQSCIDPSLGEQLYRYLTDDVPDAERELLESHLDHCGYCQSALVNWHSISQAIERFGSKEREGDV